MVCAVHQIRLQQHTQCSSCTLQASDQAPFVLSALLKSAATHTIHNAPNKYLLWDASPLLLQQQHKLEGTIQSAAEDAPGKAGVSVHASRLSS